MRFFQLATLLSLGAGSLAVLIPPSDVLNSEQPVYKVKNTKHSKHPKGQHLTPEAQAIAALSQTVEVPCESCPFPNGNHGAYISTPNNLVLTLSLDPDHRDTISLNGRPMFPAIYAAADPRPFTVTQRSLQNGAEVKIPVNIDLFIETDDSGLSRLRLHVLEVSGWKTQATMNILEFPVFQNEAGEVFIGEVHVREPTPAEASAVMCKDDMFCRWKAYLYDTLVRIANAVKGVRKGGCRGKKNQNPQAVGSEQQQQQEQTTEGDEKHHKEHKEHGHKWRWFQWVGLVVRLILACLVIAAITITIGLFFTLIVSTIIHVAVISWLFISGKSRACRRQQTTDEEESGLMPKDEESQLEAQEYSDDLPIYSENQEK